MGKILVVGGTGMLGRPVVVHLLSNDLPVRIFTTDEPRARDFFGDHTDFAEGDVGDIESLKRAMDGCEAVYINLKGGPNDDEYTRIELEGSKNIYTAAKQAGISKVVQISHSLADKRHSHFITQHVKYEAELDLISSGLTYTILKPSWFCESLPLFMKDSKAVYVGSGKTSFYFLAVTDYANIVSQCFMSDKADNKILTIFGPEPMPLPEALRRFLSTCHPNITIDQLPLWLAKFSTLFSSNKMLKSAVKLMGFFDKHGDDEVETSPDEANKLFGAPTTTVDEWSLIYRKIVKGM
ncbi:MAG: NAD(P)H-binding protein [candidate division Zixibacteria bacterium]|nr:NAD(P)H-binding protein [candidate division Zixibacteria bacterium]